MGTLSETAIATQKVIKITVIAIAAIIFLRVSWVTVSRWWAARHPDPPAPPTVSFNKLPQIVFPESQKEVTVSLETITGTTPELADQGLVYLVQSQKASLLALDKAKEQALRLGFTQEPQALTEEDYRWLNEGKLPETLEMNIINGSFTLRKNWQKDPTLLLEKNLSGKEEAILESKSFLQRAGLLSDDLKEAEVKVNYLKVSGSGFQTALSLSEADFVRVDLFRASVEKAPFLTSDPDEGIIYILFSGSRINYKRIIEVVYRYFPINYENSSTYPLKSSRLAWEELEKGQGFIASLDKNVTEVKVRKVSLAYFDGYKAQEFIQPIFVFEGDNNFKAYVPAITSEWLEGSASDDLQKPTQ